MRNRVLVLILLLVVSSMGLAQDVGPTTTSTVYLPPEGTFPYAPPVEVETPPPKIWSGDLDIGLNGTDGNSNTLQLRVNTSTKRETDTNILKATALFMYATTDSKVVENQLLFNIRDEILFGKGSPWGLFLANGVQLDQFKAYDARVTFHGGLSYMIIKRKGTSLKARVGGGTSREIGGPNNAFTPEANFGVEVEHQLTDRQKITATIDYFPNFTAWSDYRWQTEAAWEMLIDPEWNLNLKLGVADYYDSTPEGAKRNDLKYFASLLWKY